MLPVPFRSDVREPLLLRVRLSVPSEERAPLRSVLRFEPDWTARSVLRPLLRSALLLFVLLLPERMDFSTRPTDRAVDALLAARLVRDEVAFEDRSPDFLVLERVDERSVRSVEPLLVRPRWAAASIGDTAITVTARAAIMSVLRTRTGINRPFRLNKASNMLAI